LSSEKKIIKHFSKGGHAILLSSEAKNVISCIDDFIQRCICEKKQGGGRLG
jgi:hypothetical protein